MHKIGASKIMETDTVPFGCYKREVFKKTGPFDTDLVRNQDDEFNGRLQNLGGKIYLIPQVIINYTARDTLCKMRKMGDGAAGIAAAFVYVGHDSASLCGDGRRHCRGQRARAPNSPASPLGMKSVTTMNSPPST